MDELVRWLGEQLDEDERVARGCSGMEWREHPKNWVSAPPLGRVGLVIHDGDRGHIVRHDPARVLREIEADRELLRQYAEVAANEVGDVEYAHGWANALGLAVRLRASKYGDRPGYLEEWAP
jgi:hypothetical protein